MSGVETSSSPAAAKPAVAKPGAANPRRLTAEGTHAAAFEAKDWFLLSTAALIWGSSFLSIAMALKPFGPGVVTFGRVTLGFLTLSLFPAARRTRIAREHWPLVGLVGLTWMAFPMTLFPIAQQHIDSGLAGMLNGSIPLFTAVVASFGLRRLPGPAQLAGLGVGIVGILTLGWPSLSKGGSSALGVILALVACSSYGIAVNASVPLVHRYGSIPVFWRCQMVSVVLTAPLGLWGLRTARWSTTGALALGSLGILGTSVAFIAMMELAARVGSTRGSVLTYLEAIIALGEGWLFLHEKIGVFELTGSCILLFGAWLVSRADTAAVEQAIDDVPEIV